MKSADVRGTLPEKTDRNAILAYVLRLESGSRRERQMTAHDGPAAQEAPFHVEEMHRAAEAAGAAGVLPEELRHRGLW